MRTFKDHILEKLKVSSNNYVNITYKEFFDLFIDFKGYVDFFYLQDCVSTDYQSVIFWIGDGDLSKNPMPKTVDEYLLWIEKQLDFVSKRNKRIELEIQL